MSESTTSSQDTNSPAALPQVLTRAAIPSLIQDLDASDVLECYALVRPAPLHGIANSTIQIQKTAIGFRYRPPGGIGGQVPARRPMEMTLEYGPQRYGPSLHHEAMLYVQESEEEASLIGWENVAHVFYTRKVVTEAYSSSYYMASMTGAVLSKILAQAVEYAEKRRRYQPFAVFSEKNGREVRSSSSVDFTQYIWRKLAKLGVEIHPILPPPIYETRLWADSWERVAPTPVITNEAASFYTKLYQCLEAIATNDYSAYIKTEAPTQSPMPSAAPSFAGSALPSASPSLTSSSPPTNRLSHQTLTSPIHQNTTAEGESSTQGAFSAANETGDKEVKGNNAGGRRLENVDEDLWEDFEEEEEEFLDDDIIVQDEENEFRPGMEDHTEQPSSNPSFAPSISFNPTMSPAPTTPMPTITSAEDQVEEAKQAAAEAAKEGLLSGDGTIMTTIVQHCLTDPKYDIVRIDENGNATVSAFLYRDGSNFYKLNLTSPYLEIAKINRALPTVEEYSGLGNGVDFVDFVLATLVICSIVLMVVAILQQMGHKFFPSLFHCQRWFFNPGKYDYEGNKLDDMEEFVHCGEDGIPLSMGGRASNISPINQMYKHARAEPVAKPEGLDIPHLPPIPETNEQHQEVEMSKLPKRRIKRMFSGRDGSDLTDDEQEDEPNSYSEQRYRDPDLVAMPYLSSNSKVAVPVGTNGDRSRGDNDSN